MTQFNVSCLEQMQGVMEAAIAKKAPVLFGTSEGDSSFLHMPQAVALVESYRKETGLPVFLNFDHGKTLEILQSAADAGYDALHFDGSAHEFKENIALAKKVVAMARKKKISVVEGEFGEIPGGHSEFHKNTALVLDKENYTDPEQAREFVKKTGVDSLAVLIGTVHGVFHKNPPLDIERLQEIRNRVTCFYVLHGGSGTPENDLAAAIRNGVVKVNISTDLRAAFVLALRDTMAKNPEEIAPYKILPPSIEAVRKVAEGHLLLMGSANKI